MADQITLIREIFSLPFGVGKVGSDHHLNGTEKADFKAALLSHQYEVPAGLQLPIDCIDERKTIGLADGTNDPAVLAKRFALQLPGGAVLATMKAGIAADAVFLRTTKNATEAYETTRKLLKRFGIQDSAHDGCGASKLVLPSVAERLSTDVLIHALVGFGLNQDEITGPILILDRNKIKRLKAGFYQSWDPAWHAASARKNCPENFSYLEIKNDEVSGHYGSGLLLIRPGYFFAKNQFIEDTGKHAFAIAFGEADRIAKLITENDEEQILMSLAFRDDALNVKNHIAAPGLEVYV